MISLKLFKFPKENSFIKLFNTKTNSLMSVSGMCFSHHLNVNKLRHKQKKLMKQEKRRKKDDDLELDEKYNNLILEIPVRRVNPYIIEVPKTGKRKPGKYPKVLPDEIKQPELNSTKIKDAELLQYSPERFNPRVIDANTPMKKIRVTISPTKLYKNKKI
jgi:hypothetical protein